MLEPGWTVKIQEHESKTFWGYHVGSMSVYDSSEALFEFTPVSAGQYEAVASRDGYPSVRRCFEILPGETVHSLAMTLPSGTASIHGKAHFPEGDRMAIQVLVWNPEQTIVHLCDLARDDTFKVSHLPAGKYFVARASLIGRDAHIKQQEVTVYAGQHQNVNLEVNRGT